MKNERERRTLPSVSAARTVLGDLMPCSLAVELPRRRRGAANLRDSFDDYRRLPGELPSLAPHLLNALIGEALIISRKISEPTSRATGLVSLARFNLSIGVRGISRRGRTG
jgi:hypothetical protein